MKALPPALRNLIRLVLLVCLIWGAVWLVRWAHGLVPLADAGGAGLSGWLTFALLAAYAVMMAVPYLPGIEVGIALLMIGGAWVAPAVWAATVVGLLTAYAIGRLVPDAALIRLCRDLGLRRVAAAVERVAPMPPGARLAQLEAALPLWLQPYAAPGRYLLLACLLNLPGNIALGDGGGLMMFAGLSRLFAPLPTVLTVLLAVAPVPLAVWIMGQMP